VARAKERVRHLTEIILFGRLRRQRDQREIRRVLVHQIGEVKHIHVYTAVETGGVDRIAIIGAGRGRNAKRQQQKASNNFF